MRIAILSVHGRVGSRIAAEAQARGHAVLGIGRRAQPESFEGGDYRQVDIADVGGLTGALRGSDVVVYAGAPMAKGLDRVEEVVEGIVAACKAAGIARLLMVGGGGTSEIAPGKLYLYTKYFSKTIRPIVAMHDRLLEVMRREKDLDWAVQTPPAMMEENVGTRTGRYRTGKNNMIVTDETSTDYPRISTISMQDYAVAMLDEIEHPAHHFERYTVGY